MGLAESSTSSICHPLAQLSPSVTEDPSGEGKVHACGVVRRATQLNRLGEASEVEELGLLDALADHICLVEWAAHADGLLPQADVTVRLSEDQNNARRISITAAPPAIIVLEKAAAREEALIDFLFHL